ncbi:MAG: arginine--tRNA ligase [Saprospiraceae bacterium]|nr:arginine--tRNA ligase [Saprospiraceae bacterium]
MQSISSALQKAIIEAINNLYQQDVDKKIISLQYTKKEFEGDFTLVVFPFLSFSKKSPEKTAEEIGNYLVSETNLVTKYQVVKGFLNLTLSTVLWSNFLSEVLVDPDYGTQPSTTKNVMVEFCSPNTNKPLHLGHIRNILLGWACSNILMKVGHNVKRVQVINDRGIAICKSMLAWMKFGANETPMSTNIKGDHFVGDYYVLFEKKFQEEYKEWQNSKSADELFLLWKAEDKNLKIAAKELNLDIAELTDESLKKFYFTQFKNQYFNSFSTLGKEAKQMLLNWESGDADTLALWNTMNNWVKQGFDETNHKLGIEFDKTYLESETYEFGKSEIQAALSKGTFYENPDHSIWIDLTDAKLDQKLVLRSDGTSVYITQDIGMAIIRNNEFHLDQVVYVVGDEQNYHFQVLFAILKKMGQPYADNLHHLSYGMVELPTGKMKSREGTVVDADDLIEEVIQEAKTNSVDRGELSELSENERNEIYEKIGLAALKFHMLKVNPKRRMIFDPKESVELQGHTGPYVQNAYVRILSVIRKSDVNDVADWKEYQDFNADEMALLIEMYKYPELLIEAADTLDPSIIANYAYQLAKLYHKFYHDNQILRAQNESIKHFRLALSKAVALVLASSFKLLGISMPDKM